MAAVTILAEEGVLPVVATVELLMASALEMSKCVEIGRKTGFLADFGPDFLIFLAIKSTSIYRRWKREILSILRKNFSP